jgi:DNA-binding NarL/FixJ family response regulator
MSRKCSFGSPYDGTSDFTVHAREVPALLCEGMDEKTMARTLNVSDNTVRNHARVAAAVDATNEGPLR